MLLSLGIPIVVGQVGTIILGFADTLMVGHHSVMELAAASFVNTIMAIILVLALGFSYGLTPMVGQLFGRGEREKIGSVMKNGLAAGTLTSIILLGVLTAVYLNVDKLGQPEELLPLVRPYLLVNMISVPFACWFNSFKQFYDAIGNTKMSMYILLAGNVANIVGNYLLIYGPGPLPELGLLGAGLSTMLSRVMMFVVAFAIFMISKRYKAYSRSFREARLWRSVPPGEQAELARVAADGNGVGGVLADGSAGGMARHNGTGCPSGDDHCITGVLHDILRHCRCGVGESELLRGTE